MFDIGWSEMLLVAVIAIVVIGPKDLPAALRQAGKWMGAVRRMASDFQGQVNEAMKEAELDGLRQELNELKRTAQGFTNPVHTIRDEMRGAIEGKTAAAGMATAVPLAEDVPEMTALPVSATEPPATAAPIAPHPHPDVETIAQPRPADLPLPAAPEAVVHFPAEPVALADAEPLKPKPKRVRAKKITVTEAPPPEANS
jgi:sec-independent protein translocase protein TatB